MTFSPRDVFVQAELRSAEERSLAALAVVMIAGADGGVSSEESAMISAALPWVSPAELSEILGSAKLDDVKARLAELDRPAVLRVLGRVYAIAAADGVVSDEERALIEGLATAGGFIGSWAARVFEGLRDAFGALGALDTLVGDHPFLSLSRPARAEVAATLARTYGAAEMPLEALEPTRYAAETGQTWPGHPKTATVA